MTPSGRVRAAAAAVAFALVAVGAPLLLLMTPQYTRVLVVRVDSPALAGLDRAETLARAEEVRAFVSGAQGTMLPGELPDGRPAFDEKAVSHLEDVRGVIGGARLATLVAAALGGLYAAWTIAAGRRRELAASLTRAAWAVASVVGVAGLVALTDFDGFFTAFHAVFFAAGTWQFANDALIISLFPEPFWVMSGAAWGVLSLAAALVLGMFGRRVRAQA